MSHTQARLSEVVSWKKNQRLHHIDWRGGLVVSSLDSVLRGPGSSPGQVIVLCSWARHFTLTVSLSTQE